MGCLRKEYGKIQGPPDLAHLLFIFVPFKDFLFSLGNLLVNLH